MRTLTSETLSEICHALYECAAPRRYVYFFRFRLRCLVHHFEIEELDNFFSLTPRRQLLVHWVPEFIEQVTRHFFYKDSTRKSRVKLVENHIQLLEKLFSDAAIEALYRDRQPLTLWEESFQDKPLTLGLYFHSGDRKEGCLGLRLDWNHGILYRIIFWFDYTAEGQPVLCVGALQGHKSEEFAKVIHGLTKAYFGYRTKNLIFFALRQIAKNLGMSSIVAITNAGHFTKNRIRSEQVLKTDLDSFWSECGGKLREDDVRFFDLPVLEPRKNEEQIKSNKRSQYRHRFEKLDTLAIALTDNLSRWLRKELDEGELLHSL